MTKISQLSSIGDSLAIGDQFLIRDIDDTGSPNKSVTVSGITRALDVGTALAPAIAFASDKNTGIYRPDADTLAFVEGGVEAMRIDSSGRVGIGTTSPSYALDIVGSSGVGLQIYENSSGNFRRLRITQESTSVTYDATYGTGDNAHRWLVGGSERMRIDSNGSVGIGTSTVYNAKFHISAAYTLATGAQIALIENSTTGEPACLGFLAVSDNTSGGNQGAIYFDAGATGTTADNKLQFTAAHQSTITPQLTLTGEGNVGIGSSSPGARLQVNAPSTSRQYTSSVLDFSNIHLDGQTASSATSALTFTSGGGGGAAVAFSRGGSVDTYIGFWTNSAGGTNAATERIRIDNVGNVGIGTSNPAVNLEVASATPTVRISATGGGTPALSLFSAGVYNWLIQGGTALTFTQDATERARIDSGGRLLVGTSSARLISSAFLGGGGANADLEVEGTALAMGSFASNRNDGFGPYLALVKSRGTTAGSFTLVSSGDGIGALSFNGTDGSAALVGAAISAFVDGTPGANDMPGRLVFSTTADGASSPTERMRIDSAGDMLLGATTSLARLTIEKAFGGGTAIDTNTTTASTTYNAAVFRHNSTAVGQIAVSTTATSYITSSDYRLKENVTAVIDGITRLQQLKPSRFNFIADPDHTVDGFIAHEAQAVVSECVTGEKDAVDADGKPVYQGIDQSKLVPLLTAALQEAIAKIESLEARITAAGL